MKTNSNVYKAEIADDGTFNIPDDAMAHVDYENSVLKDLNDHMQLAIKEQVDRVCSKQQEQIDIAKKDAEFAKKSSKSSTILSILAILISIAIPVISYLIGLQ